MSPIITPVTARFKQPGSSAITPNAQQSLVSPSYADGDDNPYAANNNQNAQKQNLFQQIGGWVQQNIAGLLAGAGSVGGIGGATYLATKKDSGEANSSPVSRSSQNNLPSSPTSPSPNQPSNNRNPGNLSTPFAPLFNIAGGAVDLVGNVAKGTAGVVGASASSIVGAVGKVAGGTANLVGDAVNGTGSLLKTPVQDLTIIKYALNQWKDHKEAKKTEAENKADQAFETRRQAHINQFEAEMLALSSQSRLVLSEALKLANYYSHIGKHPDALSWFNSLSSHFQSNLEGYIQGTVTHLDNEIGKYPEILLNWFLTQQRIDPNQLASMLRDNLAEIDKYLNVVTSSHSIDLKDEASVLQQKAILQAAGGQHSEAVNTLNEAVRLLNLSKLHFYSKVPEIHEYKQFIEFFNKMTKSELHDLLPKVLKDENNNVRRFRKEALLRNVFDSYRHHIAHP